MSISPSCRSLRILLVDDEPAFRISLADSLRDDGHDVLEYVAPGEVALDALADIGLLVSDYDMPEQDGLAFADAFHARHAAAPVILVTAYRNHALDGATAERGFVLVEKPMVYEELHRLMHDLTG